MNEIKTVARAGMGACGGRTCRALIQRLFRDEGVPDAEVVDTVRRPLFMEVPLGVFAGMGRDGGPEGAHHEHPHPGGAQRSAAEVSHDGQF